ncbi:MAG: muconolactone Delta-isomerase [Bacteriovoracaceae bacterium]|nr:muconolactone Delta-isomerase [Bacteriovoracaceae bacterium]
MLFHVKMTVNIPSTVKVEVADELKKKEREFSQKLQKEGKWKHIWRIAGHYANYSIFDVKDNEELHELLMQLPLFPYMEIEVNALCKHPSSIV